MYLLIALAHVPLLLVAQPKSPGRPLAVRTALWIGFTVVTAGFLLMFTISHDKARWFANWFAGLILLVHAAYLVLPEKHQALDALRSPKAVAAGWTLAVISYVGLMAP